MPGDSEPLGEPPLRQPTRELLLAQALDACIEAERNLSGSAHEIIAQQPFWARADLQRLLDLAGSLDAAATNAVMSEDFRVAARGRLMQRMYADAGLGPVPLPGARLAAVPSRGPQQVGRRRRHSRWLWRSSAGLLAAVLAITATLTASASALPGEPLYSLKQAQEELGVRLAADDQARAMALLRRADARLDETARLLRDGRTDAALETTLRYDQVVERATTTYVVTIDDLPSDAPITAHFDTKLSQQQEQLQAMLQFAPEPARADLREALVATERGRALVADPQPVERALGRVGSSRSVAAAAVPIVSAEDLPTPVPTVRPTIEQPLQKPAVVAQVQGEASGAMLVGKLEDSDNASDGQGSRERSRAPAASTEVRTVNTANNSARGSGSAHKPILRSGSANENLVEQHANSEASQRSDETPPLIARDDQSDRFEPNPQFSVRTSTGAVVSRGQSDEAAGQSGRNGGGGALQTQADNRAAPSGSATEVRGRDADEQPVVARQGSSSSSSASRTTQSASSSSAMSSQNAQIAQSPNSQKESDRSARDTGDARGAAPVSPGAASKPVATPTPATASARRGGGESDKSSDKSAPSRGGGGSDHSAGDDH